MGEIIAMQAVSWRRNQQTILSDINWHVKRGEHWAVLGLNGAGKTSLLNMVNGYIWPTTGEVSVLGQRFGETNLSELRKSIGWVSSSLGERINGRHFVEDIVVSGKYGATIMYQTPSAADYSEADEIMALVSCHHLKNNRYETCSHGEKQKILIARALMAAPALLILDEPTSGLDFLAREELLTMLTRLAQEAGGPTLILITHHIEEVLPLFSHALLLKQGKIAAQGPRKQIITSDHLSRYYEQSITVEWRKDRAWMSLAADEKRD